MRGFNKVILAGNLTADPDLRSTVNRRSYMRFNLAVNSKYKNNNGELQDVVDYIPIVVWGAMAETLGKYLRKGSPVLVEGRIKTGSFVARDGSKKFTTDIYADNITMLGSSNGDRQQARSQNGSNNAGDFSQEWNQTFGSGGMNDNFNGGGDFGKSLNDGAFDDSNSDDDIPF